MARGVFLLSESFGWSGGAAQVLALAKALPRSEWDPLIICPEGGALYQNAQNAGIKTFHWSPFQDYDIFTALKLARLIDLQKPSIVHAHHPKAHAMGLLACYMAKHRAVFVVSRRVSHPMRYNIFSRFKYKNSKIDCYIAVAKSVGKILKDYGIPEEKIATIYSGVDEQKFSPRPPDEKIIKELAHGGAPVVGLIGNYSKDKGQEIFLRAAKSVLESGRKAIFLCAGRDTDSAELNKIAQELKIPPQSLRLLGFRTDVAEIISTLSISVNAALAGEALSGSIRESMAMKIPVVASDISGNGEIVRHGETGYLFTPGDAGELAKLITESLDNPQKSKLMAEAGYEFVIKNLTAAVMAQKTQDCYLNLLARKTHKN
ncbi:MAG: glycosyltransferase family 4 protein [Elusimicrobia bacterium]|nr:glycosyltransferase family 4 protein [Elusimicrobiota bacterium]